MDRAKFFNVLRPHINLTTQNVQGFDKHLDYATNIGIKLNALAYVLATSFWETAQSMWPVREAFWLSEDWRRRNLRYYPWYGRGLVQVTWEANYKKVAAIIGLPEDTFTKNPNLLLEWNYALPALFVGMMKGIYTGKKLGDYVDDVDENDDAGVAEYKAARRVVNGTDKAAEIARLAIVIETALKEAGYNVIQLPPEAIVYEIGSKGDIVGDIQKLLGFTPDKDYGKLTAAAVMGWQAAKGLSVTGRVDYETLDSMNLVEQRRLL